VDHVLLCPKVSAVEAWFSSRPPIGVGACHTPFPADPSVGRVLASAFGAKPVVFVGDLDPVGVAQYLAAAAMLKRITGRRLLFGGIDATWLTAFEPPATRIPLEKALIDMAPDEVRLLRRLDEGQDLDSLLGPAACAILRGGYKVELEAVSNPAIVGAGYTRRAFRHLRSVASGAKGRGGSSFRNG
jgi:hypothetical protein